MEEMGDRSRHTELLLFSKPWEFRDYFHLQTDRPTEFRIKGPISDSHLESLKRAVNPINGASLEWKKDKKCPSAEENWKVVIEPQPDIQKFLAVMFKLHLRIRYAKVQYIVALEG